MEHHFCSCIVATLLILRTSAQSTPVTTASHCIGLEVDGTADEWDSCEAPEITLDMVQVNLPRNDLLRGALQVRFAHDGTNIYVLARVWGDYHFNLTAGVDGFAHAVSVMWKVGENAIMNDMGGCSPPLPPSGNPYDCPAIQAMCANTGTSVQCGNCDASRLTDIWHVETDDVGALPGVKYPWRGPVVFANSDGTYSSLGYQPEGLGQYQPAVERLFSGNDQTGNSEDEFAVHPCLRGDDGMRSNAFSSFQLRNVTHRNQIRYAWSHTAINSFMYPFGTIGASGQYTYEFSRPLVTNENTDVQFQVGQNASYAFAFWVPPAAGERWEEPDHYLAPSNIQFGTVMLKPMATNSAPSIAKSGLMFAIICVAISLQMSS